MKFTKDSVRIPYNEYYAIEKEEPRAPPPMYDQTYVDCLHEEIDYYKRRYREYLLKYIRK